jgi:hypothetical protein
VCADLICEGLADLNAAQKFNWLAPADVAAQAKEAAKRRAVLPANQRVIRGSCDHASSTQYDRHPSIRETARKKLNLLIFFSRCRESNNFIAKHPKIVQRAGFKPSI